MKTKQLIFSFCAITALSALILTDASAASVRVRCVKGTGFSTISVDGRDLVSGKSYRGQAISGANKKSTALKPANVNGEDAFDFSSKPNDIAAGATPISALFIRGTPPSVTGKIIDAAGFTVISDTVNCRVK